MRSRLFHAAVCIIAPLLSVCLTQAVAGADASASQDWPWWRGPSYDNQCPAVPETMPKFELLWKQRVAPGRCDAGLAAAEGVVVAADSDGRRNDYYWCYDAQTGKQRWMARVPNAGKMAYGIGPRATPAIYKGKVVVIGAFGDVHCYDLKTGRELWKKDYRRDFGAGPRPPEWGYSVAPLIFEDKLILMPGDLVALDPNTGKTLWRTKTAGANYSAFTPAVVGSTKQIIGYDADSAGGWDVATGNRLWSLPIDNSKHYTVPSPVMVAGKLLLSTESDKSRLLAFADDGKVKPTPLAENADLNPQISTPTIVNGLALCVWQGLFCLDPNDGLKTLWINDKQDTFLGDVGHIVAGKTTAMVFGDKGEMVMIRPTREKCEVLGKIKLCTAAGASSIVWAHPALLDKVVFVRDDKYLYAWRMSPTQSDK